jgi:chromosome segregation ATPase
MSDPALALARDLERRDAALGAAIEQTTALLSEAEALRVRAEEIRATLLRFPAEEAEAEALVSRVREELERRRAELARAEQELDAAARSDDAMRARSARRALDRARDAASFAQDRLARAEEALAGARRNVEDAGSEVPRLEDGARRLAERLRAVPRLSEQGREPPGTGLDAILEWWSRARAALWVVRSGLEEERELVVREANELAASALGEPLYATGVSGVRERLERGS